VSHFWGQVKITGEQFVELIKENPSWCLNVTEPLEVTTFVFLGGSLITHLSPLIYFSGKCEDEFFADTKKGIVSASFNCCDNLKVATGTFKGFVNFQDSGITTIKDLTIKNTNAYGVKAIFVDCPIKYVPKEYRGEEFEYADPDDYFFDGFSEVIENSKLRDKTIKDTIAKIKSEANNIEI
jgi:hypothetical protein